MVFCIPILLHSTELLNISLSAHKDNRSDLRVLVSNDEDL